MSDNNAVGKRRSFVEQPRGLPEELQVILMEAQLRLRNSGYPELHLVSCEFHEGVLSLRGHVSSFYLKQIAQTLIRGLAGVGEVNNRLEVAPSPVLRETGAPTMPEEPKRQQCPGCVGAAASVERVSPSGGSRVCRSSGHHIDHPQHAKTVGNHAELRGKERLRQGHLHLTTVAQGREQPFPPRHRSVPSATAQNPRSSTTRCIGHRKQAPSYHRCASWHASPFLRRRAKWVQGCP